MDENTSATDKENCNFAIVMLVFFGIVIGLMKYIINQVRPGRPQIGVDPTQELMKSDLNKTQDNLNKENIGLEISGTIYSAVKDMKAKDIDSFLDDDYTNHKPKKRGFDLSSKIANYQNPNDASVLRAEELAYDYSSSTGVGTPDTNLTKKNTPSRTRTPPEGDEVLKFHYSLKRKDRSNL